MTQVIYCELSDNNKDVLAYNYEGPREHWKNVRVMDEDQVVMVDGVIYLKENAPDVVLEKLQEQKIQEMNSFLEEKSREIKRGTPRFERESWDIQRNEYIRWKEDPEALTPFIDQIAESQGETRLNVLQSVGKKLDAYNLFMASLVGERQAWKDRIKKATVEELQQMNWGGNNEEENARVLSLL